MDARRGTSSSSTTSSTRSCASGRRGSGLVVNVGTGVQTTIRDLWAPIAPDGPAPTHVAPARPDELLRFAVSPVRARIHLGWSPWTSLDEGLSALTLRLTRWCRSAAAARRGARRAAATVGRRASPTARRRAASLPPRRSAQVRRRRGRSPASAAIGAYRPGDADHRWLVAELGEHPVGRALQRSAADDRRHGHDRSRVGRRAGRRRRPARGSARSRRSGSTVRRRRRRPSASAASDIGAPGGRRPARTRRPRPAPRGGAARSSPGTTPPRRRPARSSWRRGRRSSAAAARRRPTPGDLVGDLRRRGTLGQAGGAVEVGGEVAVAEVEPRRRGASSPPGGRRRSGSSAVHRRPRLVGQAPARARGRWRRPACR